MSSSPPPFYYSHRFIPLNVFELNQYSRQLARRDDPAPSYSSGETADNRETIGPRSYPISGSQPLLIYVYFIVQFFMACSSPANIGIFLNIQKFGLFCIWLGGNNRKEQMNWVAVGGIYLISRINIWLGMMFVHKNYMTLARFKLAYFLWTPSPYLFLLDQVMLIGMPFLALNFGIDVHIPFYGGIIMVIFNLAAFYLVANYEITAYEPLLNNEQYSLLSEDTETRADSPFHIIGSSAFKITMKVLGPTERPTTGGRGPKVTKDVCPLHFGLDADVPIETLLMMIPETHELPGAIKVKDYRSFGYNRMNSVKTFIYGADENGSRILFSKFTQKFGRS